MSGSGTAISVSSIAPAKPAHFGVAVEAIGLSPINEGSAVHDRLLEDYQVLSDNARKGGNSCSSEGGGDEKGGPEFDVMDNEKGLDGSRPITEAIATRPRGSGDRARSGPRVRACAAREKSARGDTIGTPVEI